jgi:acylphosphatase
MERGRVHLTIEGRVQGVFFRASALAEANRLGLKGWVKNRPDGSVEAVAEGEKEKLEALAAWCRHGPRGASVERIRLQWQEYRGEFDDFSVTS